MEPSGGNRYISLNTTVKPLDNVNVRRAISAVIDRDALRQTRGGPYARHDRTHFLPPGIAGFEEAGGEKGPGFDFSSNPTANVALAKQYMKKAGYSNGQVQRHAAADGRRQRRPAKETAEAFQGQVEKIGIKLKLPQGAAGAVLHEVLPACRSQEGPSARTRAGARTSSPRRAARSAVQRHEHRQSAATTTRRRSTTRSSNGQIDKARRSPRASERDKAWGELDKKSRSRPPPSRGCGTTTTCQSKNMNGVSSA